MKHFQKPALKAHHKFYLGFFVFYCLAQYYFLYAGTGLGAFQTNIHFFSNVVGSFSKRFISEVAPYGLVFFLLYHTKANWKRNVLAGVFIILFTLNVLTIAYYFTHSANWRADTLVVNAKLMGATVIVFAIALGLTTVVMGYRNGSRKIIEAKKNLFVALLILLTLLSPFIPVQYSLHRSLIATQEGLIKIFRVFELSQPGTTLAYGAFFGKTTQLKIPKADNLTREVRGDTEGLPSN